MQVFLVALLATILSGAAIASPASRIVGGHFTENETQFPYQVALFERDQFKCGASIIAERWILTAAHCIDGSVQSIEDLTVHVGSHHLHEGGRTLKLAKLFPHSEYNTKGYDIGLMQLQEPLVFDDTVHKIELYRGELPSNAKVTISGHGKTGNDEPTSEVLKFNTMTVMSEQDCAEEIAFTRWNNVICLNNAVDNGICTGDSGSAAVYDGKQIGVASFVLGFKGCGSNRPDGFAFVPLFVEWIEKTMKEASSSVASFY